MKESSTAEKPTTVRRLVILGFGSIGVAALPLIQKHISDKPGDIAVISGDRQNEEIAHSLGFSHFVISRDNFATLLGARLAPGDVLINL